MGRPEVVDMVGLEGIGEGQKCVGKVLREVADIVVEHQGMQFADWEDIGYIELEVSIPDLQVVMALGNSDQVAEE